MKLWIFVNIQILALRSVISSISQSYLSNHKKSAKPSFANTSSLMYNTKETESAHSRENVTGSTPSAGRKTVVGIETLLDTQVFCSLTRILSVMSAHKGNSHDRKSLQRLILYAVKSRF